MGALSWWSRAETTEKLFTASNPVSDMIIKSGFLESSSEH
jgi:hypothetical protein